jgi:hypothetical protein
MKIKSFHLAFFCLWVSTAFAQYESSFSPSFRLAGHTGLLIPHRVAMQHLPEAPTTGLEANIEFGGKDELNWSKIYNHPIPGISFYASTLGNNRVLGTGYGICPYFLIPHIRTEKFNLYTGWGWGLGYVTKHWHRTENHKNVVTGSGLNIYINIKLLAEFQITPKWAIYTFAAFNHFSNSNIAQPNLGINSPTLGLGLSYRRFNKALPTVYKRHERKELAKTETKYRINLVPSAGVRARNTTDNSLHDAYNMGVSVVRCFSRKSRLGAGTDFFYNTANRTNLDLAGKRENAAFQAGLFAQYEQVVGRTSLIISMGTYIFDQSERNDPIYHRMGTRVWLSENLFVKTTLHSHWAVADHMEFGLGWSIAK